MSELIEGVVCAGVDRSRPLREEQEQGIKSILGPDRIRNFASPPTNLFFLPCSTRSSYYALFYAPRLPFDDLVLSGRTFEVLVLRHLDGLGFSNTLPDRLSMN